MFGTFPAPFVEGLRKGKSSPAFAVAKGGDTMNEPNRTQWQIRCAFNGFCKRTLKNESINAHGEIKRRQLQEVSFSDLTPQEENQLYTYDTYFEHDEAEKSFCVAGKEITAAQHRANQIRFSYAEPYGGCAMTSPTGNERPTPRREISVAAYGRRHARYIMILPYSHSPSVQSVAGNG